jgi:hypothetical protein
MRPFRNPSNREEWQANFDWKAEQLQLPIVERSPDYLFQPAWRVDPQEYLQNFGPDHFDDAFGGVEFPARDAQGRRIPRPERAEREMATNAAMMKRFPTLNLDKLPDGPEIIRDIKLPPFKIDYDTHEQIHQKLNGTIILIKNRPFVVSETCEFKKGKFALAVYDTEREQKIVYYDDIADCRGIAPGYFTHRGAAHWTYRVPERQNSQGMHQRNMQCKQAGSKSPTSARSDFLLAALGVVKDVKYAANLHDIILGGGAQSIRLTNRLALYATGKKGAPIGVEYCGRALGLIVNDQCKVHDECDLMPSWMQVWFLRLRG